MAKLRQATPEEAERILKFYQDIIDSVKGTQFNPKWGRHYPNLEFIKTSIEKGELYICTQDDLLIVSVVLNNRFDPEYENIDWKTDANHHETIIIHHNPYICSEFRICRKRNWKENFQPN